MVFVVTVTSKGRLASEVLQLFHDFPVVLLSEEEHRLGYEEPLGGRVVPPHVDGMAALCPNVVSLAIGQEELVSLEAELVDAARVDHHILSERQVHGAPTRLPLLRVEHGCVVPNRQEASAEAGAARALGGRRQHAGRSARCGDGRSHAASRAVLEHSVRRGQRGRRRRAELVG